MLLLFLYHHFHWVYYRRNNNNNNWVKNQFKQICCNLLNHCNRSCGLATQNTNSQPLSTLQCPTIESGKQNSHFLSFCCGHTWLWNQWNTYGHQLGMQRRYLWESLSFTDKRHTPKNIQTNLFAAFHSGPDICNYSSPVTIT